MRKRLTVGAGVLWAVCLPALARPGEAPLRVATFNIHDAKTDAITSGDDERLKRIARVILDIHPDIILLNEIDQDPACANAQHFAENYLAVKQGEHEPINYHAIMRPSNTGVFSGLDLDNNGVCDPKSSPRDYGGDCLGYGEYPGQYGMAILVRNGLTIDDASVRTFQHFLWKDMPGALLPPLTDGAGSWYSDEELAVLPLSSKSHWDVSVILENGATVHILASHPTPPVFDGPEDRNGRRNHDEIRFWADYISGGDDAAYIVDDAGRPAGLAPDAHFVILGDLNAAPDEGDSRNNPMRLLLLHPRVNTIDPPFSTIPQRTTRRGERVWLADTDTSEFGMQIDHVLPSSDMKFVGSRVYRDSLDVQIESSIGREEFGIDWDLPDTGAGWAFPSDHFPVFIDLSVPGPEQPGKSDDATIPSGKNP